MDIKSTLRPMTETEFNEIKQLIASKNDEDNKLGVNILRALGEEVNEIIFDSLAKEGCAEVSLLLKYFSNANSYHICDIRDFKLRREYE